MKRVVWAALGIRARSEAQLRDRVTAAAAAMGLAGPDPEQSQAERGDPAGARRAPRARSDKERSQAERENTVLLELHLHDRRGWIECDQPAVLRRLALEVPGRTELRVAELTQGGQGWSQTVRAWTLGDTARPITLPDVEDAVLAANGTPRAILAQLRGPDAHPLEPLTLRWPPLTGTPRVDRVLRALRCARAHGLSADHVWLVHPDGTRETLYLDPRELGLLRGRGLGHEVLQEPARVDDL